MDYPSRKLPRLRNYDYSQPGYYFITICTIDKQCTLGEIQMLSEQDYRLHLSTLGEIVRQQLMDLEVRFPTVVIDKYVIMPNHIHLLLHLRQAEPGTVDNPSVSQIIGTFKSLTTKACWQHGINGTVFQTSFHDHVIRSQADYEKIWQYIEGNPSKWAADCFCPDSYFEQDDRNILVEEQF